MGLSEKILPRCYHSLDNNWTPLSWNPCWLSNAICLISATYKKARPCLIFSVYTFVKENLPLIIISGTDLLNHLQTTYSHPGIVSMRVAFALRSAEIFPRFLDLFSLNLFSHKELAELPKKYLKKNRIFSRKSVNTNPHVFLKKKSFQLSKKMTG